MRATTATDLRKNLAAELDRVNDDREPLIIVRTGGKPAAVLLSVEDYESLTETDYLLSSPANAERLAEGVDAFEKRQGRRVDLPE